MSRVTTARNNRLKSYDVDCVKKKKRNNDYDACRASSEEVWSFPSSEILVGRMLMRERDRRGEVANYLHVTRFIMLAPIARNTLRSFRGVIHRGVITNAYCGSAEAREPARPANFVVRERYHFAVSLPLSLSLSRLDFNFVPVSSFSRHAGK